MIGFRMTMIAAGYEDGNDANRLRSDPVFKMAQDALPSGRDLASQSTMCRLENLPDVGSLLAMGRAMVDLYCRRGAAENHIKSWKTHLAADRTSCTKATASQFRLFLHAGAYWLMWGPARCDAEALELCSRAIRHAAFCASSRSPRGWPRSRRKSACTCRHPAPTSASCASSLIGSRGS
jgi:hypothetical protein